MNKTSISFALARFVFFSCIVLSTITTLLVANYVVNSVNKENDKVIKREIYTISNDYKIFLDQNLILLTEQANNPLIIQTLMQPESNSGKIKDFMSDLTLLGEKFSETLVDFEGVVIHSTNNETLTNYQQFSWMDKVLSEQKSNISIIKIKSKHYWSVTVPVLYNKNVEGALIANIPLERIDQQGKFYDRPSGVLIEIIKNEQPLVSFGSLSTGPQHTIHWPDVGVSFRFTIDEKMRNQERENAVLQISALVIFAITITTLLAYFYGYRYFVSPIHALSKASDEIEQGKQKINLPDDLRIKELAELFKKFNRMSYQVTTREEDLKASNIKLLQLNEELKQSESQLVQSEKMASIGVLASGVAHEINNPIGFIKSNLEVLQEYINDILAYNQEVADLLKTSELHEKHQQLIEKHDLAFILNDTVPLLTGSIGGVDRVAEIIQGLKTFARVDAPKKLASDLNEGLKATLKMVLNELKYNCEVHVDLKPLPVLLAHPGKLNQVFMNLLINAGQAITSKGDIYVRSLVVDNNIVIEVEDTGCGMSKEQLSQIFTPFYTSKPIGEGTGLGLSISHQIVEQHNGKIVVTSEQGRGSCFSVQIPFKEKGKQKD